MERHLRFLRSIRLQKPGRNAPLMAVRCDDCHGFSIVPCDDPANHLAGRPRKVNLLTDMQVHHVTVSSNLLHQADDRWLTAFFPPNRRNVR